MKCCATRAAGRGRHALQFESELDIVLNRAPRQEAEFLEHHGAVGARPADALVAQLEIARFRLEEAQQVLRKVLLPQPEGPTIDRNSPSRTSMSKPWSARTGARLGGRKVSETLRPSMKAPMPATPSIAAIGCGRIVGAIYAIDPRNVNDVISALNPRQVIDAREASWTISRAPPLLAPAASPSKPTTGRACAAGRSSAGSSTTSSRQTAWNGTSRGWAGFWPRWGPRRGPTSPKFARGCKNSPTSRRPSKPRRGGARRAPVRTRRPASRFRRARIISWRRITGARRSGRSTRTTIPTSSTTNASASVSRNMRRSPTTGSRPRGSSCPRSRARRCRDGCICRRAIAAGAFPRSCPSLAWTGSRSGSCRSMATAGSSATSRC